MSFVRRSFGEGFGGRSDAPIQQYQDQRSRMGGLGGRMQRNKNRAFPVRAAVPTPAPTPPPIQSPAGPTPQQQAFQRARQMQQMQVPQGMRGKQAPQQANPYQAMFSRMQQQPQRQGPQFPSMSQYSRPYQPQRMPLWQPTATGSGPSRARQGADWINPGYWFSDNMGEQGTKYFGLPSQEDPYPSILPGIPGTSSGGIFEAIGGLF